MDTKFVMTKIQGITVGCTIKDGTPVDIRCYEEESLIGNVYIAKVSNIVKNINAAFVDIQKGATGYLPLEDYDGDVPLKVGHELIVQVTKDGMKTKQPMVTTHISLNGEYTAIRRVGSIGVSAKIKGDALRKHLKGIAKAALDDIREECLCAETDYGIIFRTKTADFYSDESHTEEEIKEYEDMLYQDVIQTIKRLDEMLYRARYLNLYSVIRPCDEYIKDLAGMRGSVTVITDDKDIHDNIVNQNVVSAVEFYDDQMRSLDACYGISNSIRRSLQKRVELKSGGYLIIENTEAMTVIDVNSGKSINRRKKEDEIYKINIEAVREIGRQIKLRNISGIIIIDFISMTIPQNISRLLNELKHVTAFDYVGVNVFEMTRLGLVEMTRKKQRRPLHEVFTQFDS
ncbi:MAG: ribonuclease E/G [Bacteroides sp.]|nr:ribonuclease E/G [Clostridium sp.]MCM1458622.1 ribonuclease E/G [Bacteroides sp.]